MAVSSDKHTRIKSESGVKKRGRGTNNLPVTKPGRKISRPDMRKWDWEPVETYYVQGVDRVSPQTGYPERYYPTTEEVAEHFNIPLKTVRPKCAECGWVEKREKWRDEFKRKKDEQTLKALLDAELRIRTKSLKAAEKIIERVGGKDDEDGLVDKAVLPEDLSSLSSALRRSQEVANVAIGIPKDGVKAAGEGTKTEVVTTVWGKMRESRQEVVVGVRVSTE